MKLRYIERCSKYIMLRTMFCLAMDINFLIDYNILIHVDQVLASVNTIYIFPDKSKLTLYYKNLPVSMEEQSQLKEQALNTLKLSMLL